VKKILAFVALAAALFAAPAFAGDPILGTWKLNVAKSKFSAGAALTSATRVYTEANGTYMLEQRGTGTDGTETSVRASYRNGEDVKQGTHAPSGADTSRAKMIDANTWDFDLKKAGKVVGHVHRVVSADGKTLTVHNTGRLPDGSTGEQTMVFDKQ
jgi:hypothetical protein